MSNEMCEGCTEGEHWRCGMQTWCACDCDPEIASIPTEVWTKEELDSTGNDRIKVRCKDIKKLIDEQAEDQSIWFLDSTTSEKNLQHELRILTTKVEWLLKEIEELP